MRREFLKNILAGFGAFFLIVIALAMILSYAFGGGRLSRSYKVIVVNIEGVISDTSEISEKLREIGERDDIKAVVLRINSPGGAVGPSQEIYGEIKRLKKTKKVVASMGAIAASGGYYAATAANKIVANPGTITGSIGVIVEFVNATELLSKIGLKGYIVKSGKFKDTGSPFRNPTDEDTQLLQGVINDVNSQFVRAVAEGRGLKVEEVQKIADGRIFTGAQAKEKGLVDALGGLEDAIDLSARLAGIKGKPYVIYPERRGISLWRTVFGDSMANNFTELFSGMRIMYLTKGPQD